MAYISYKYPFNNQKKQITKPAKSFGLLVILSFFLSCFLVYDNYSTNIENKSTQKGLKDSIGHLSGQIAVLINDIDSLGYRKDKVTGKWEIKNPDITNNSAIVKNVSPIIQQNKTGINQANKNGKNEVNQNSGTNNGSIGGTENKSHTVYGTNNGVNGDVYQGVKQRHLTDKALNDIISKIPSTDTEISYLLNLSDKESFDYSLEIYNRLSAKGYIKFSKNQWMNPDCSDSIKYHYLVNEKKFVIVICPASNNNY